MLVGGVSILATGTASGGGRPALDLAAFRQLLRRRLAGAVALRRRLTHLPLDLARPYWTELAPDEIDLDWHVERAELPAPGGWHELSALVAWELAQPLDRRRPLWQMTWVEDLHLPGYPAGSVAVIGRVHHAAIDGVSGAEILGLLFDSQPADSREPGAEEPPPSPAPHSEEAGALELLARTGRDLAALPLELPGVVGRSLLGLATSALSQFRREESPPLLFTAPPSPLNRPLGRAQSWAPAVLDLERVKAVKAAASATVNDVVLAICSTALRGWLLERGALPAAPLVAMVPVSVRAEAEHGQAGNLVSAMLVSLATDEPDARARLRRIRDAAAAKVAHRAVGARTLLASADLLPFALSGLAVRLYSRLHLAGHHRPLFNLVVTNVPGPARRLTIGGAPLLAHFGTAPLFDGLGLILPVFSYAGKMTIGVSADRAVLPDAAAFAGRLEAALDELEAATRS